MKSIRILALLPLLLSACDAVDEPSATIREIDVPGLAQDQLVELQDVAGRSYARVHSVPADVHVQLWTHDRDYFVIVLQREADAFSVVGASDAFKATDLTGPAFTTTGRVLATLMLE